MQNIVGTGVFLCIMNVMRDCAGSLIKGDWLGQTTGAIVIYINFTILFWLVQESHGLIIMVHDFVPASI